jgi:hypothetical protein
VDRLADRLTLLWTGRQRDPSPDGTSPPTSTLTGSGSGREARIKEPSLDKFTDVHDHRGRPKGELPLVDRLISLWTGRPCDSSSQGTLPPTSTLPDSRFGHDRHEACRKELSLDKYTRHLAATIRKLQEEGAEPVTALNVGPQVSSLRHAYGAGKACLKCINDWLEREIEEALKRNPIVADEDESNVRH